MPKKKIKFKDFSSIVEEWRPVKGFSIYEVSSFGRVRSMDRVVPQRVNGGSIIGIHRKGKILKQKEYTGGYLSVRIFTNKRKQRDMAVHRLVAKAFLSNNKHLLCVHHIDGNRKNNSVNNLTWISHSENNKRAYISGKQSRKGEKNGRSKLSNADVITIKTKLQNGGDYKKIADTFRVSKKCIKDIETGRRWAWLK